MRIPILIIGAAALASAQGWRQDSAHPLLEYRISCNKGEALSILWRNGYPGEVSLKARVKSLTYDGIEEAKVAPGGTFKSDPDTMSCSLSSLSVSVVKFAMAAPPAPKPTVAAKASEKKAEDVPPPPPVPTLLRFDEKAEKLPEVSAESLAQISTGMKQADVVAKLGPPASKLSIPDDDGYVESYQYRLGGNKISIVRFSKGTVTEITRPEQ